MIDISKKIDDLNELVKMCIENIEYRRKHSLETFEVEEMLNDFMLILDKIKNEYPEYFV